MHARECVVFNEPSCPLARKQVFHILDRQSLSADDYFKHRFIPGNAGINCTGAAAQREATRVPWSRGERLCAAGELASCSFAVCRGAVKGN